MTRRQWTFVAVQWAAIVVFFAVISAHHSRSKMPLTYTFHRGVDTVIHVSTPRPPPATHSDNCKSGDHGVYVYDNDKFDDALGHAIKASRCWEPI